MRACLAKIRLCRGKIALRRIHSRLRSLQGGNLLWHRLVKSEPLEPPAQRIECRNRRRQSASSRFGCQRMTLGQTGIRERRNQCDIIKHLHHQSRTLVGIWRRPFRRRDAAREKVQLLARLSM